MPTLALHCELPRPGALSFWVDRARWSTPKSFSCLVTHPGCCDRHRYLVAAHSAPNQFVAVVGNSTLDFNYYGPVRSSIPVRFLSSAHEGAAQQR